MTENANASERGGSTKRPLVIGIVLALIVIAALGTWWGVTAGATSAREKAISDTVTDYFTAISEADPEKALSLATSPVEPGELMSKGVLESSNRQAHLTDVEVVTIATEKPYERATVDVTYKLGDNEVTDQIPLSQTADGWRLDRVTSDLTLASVHALTVNNQEVTQTAQQVLPGTYTAEPVSDSVKLTKGTSATVLRPGETTAEITAKASLSDAGIALVKKTAKKSLDTCLASKVSAPPNCPWHLSEEGVKVTKNSIKYTLKNDPWKKFSPKLLSDDLAATAQIPLTLEASAEATHKGITGKVSRTFDTKTHLRVDLSSDEPTVIWSKDKFK